MPSRILGGGARVAWDDAGETPNLHCAHFDAGDVPVVIALCNLPATPGGDRSPKRPGPGSGYIAYCEGGRLEGQRGGAAAFDHDGKLIRRFQGDGGMGRHQQNFIDAVRKQDHAILNASATIGLHSTLWCHLANIAVRVGQRLTSAAAAPAEHDEGLLGEVFAEFNHLLEAYQLTAEGALAVSPMIAFDPANERFSGELADDANALLTREFRAPFTMPQLGAEQTATSPAAS
ncbi:MAG: hypothetical protein IT424_04175 [Pirellulales bacterium]|nr:hypothetical protein [Pirellulales bacterium]